MKFISKEKLAKYVINQFVESGIAAETKESEVDPILKRKAACFVTVYVSGKLRGCIGNAVATGPLYRSITENAVAAASQDYRFNPINKEELPKLTVEVSVLTPLQKYQPKSAAEMLKFLDKEKPGLMLGKGFNRALFLPQVWEQLPVPKDFLTHLCLKAGLPEDEWQGSINYWIFTKEN